MEQLVYAVADRPARAIAIASGDITLERVDAIVNAANAELRGGGGVDGAIHRAGGPSIMEECRAYTAQRGPLRGGEAAVTTAGDLNAQVVIHVAGPIWSGGSNGEPEHLAQCYRSALAAALEAGATSIAFPSISTGVYGYPFEPAVEIGLREMRAFLDSPVGGNALAIRYVFFTREQAEMALGAARRVFAAGE